MKIPKKIQQIAEYNNPQYNIDKMLEEMGELQVALSQAKTKPRGRKSTEITDEIGDVLFRGLILAIQFGPSIIFKRIKKKMNKSYKNMIIKKYQNV